MENYFNVKEIPYSFKPMRFPSFKKTMIEKVGVQQMPAVVLKDGRWMTDTTKMIQWFESKYPEHPIIPDNSTQAFLCFLLKIGLMNGGGGQQCITAGFMKKELDLLLGI